MIEVENTPLGKWNKEEQIRAALRLKREAKLDKMKELEWEHNTPVKWISKEKNTILTIRDDEWREQHHNASGRKNRR